MWILLDSQSNAHLLCNKDPFNSIWVGKSMMVIHCNARTANTNLIGDAPLLQQDSVWFRSSDIANVMSFDQVIQHYPVTYDSHNKTIYS